MCHNQAGSCTGRKSIGPRHNNPIQTLISTISSATVLPQNVVVCAAAIHHLESSRARIDLTAALDEQQQQTQSLDLFIKYRSAFSLFPKKLGKCTIIAEAELSFQRQAKPVDNHPYRNNPRAYEVSGKCFESMKSDRIMEKSPSPWGSAVCFITKGDGYPRWCVNCRNTITKFLKREV